MKEYYCPKCHRTYDLNFKYCPVCSVKLYSSNKQKEKPPKKFESRKKHIKSKRCPDCGRIVSYYAIRCVKCNHHFKDTDDELFPISKDTTDFTEKNYERVNNSKITGRYNDYEIESGANSKTIKRMNLILNVLAKGYEFEDLDYMAHVSLNDLENWLDLGKSGNHDYKDFYEKFNFLIDNVPKLSQDKKIKRPFGKHVKSKRCPDCGRIVSYYAIRCVKCNHHFKDTDDELFPVSNDTADKDHERDDYLKIIVNELNNLIGLASVKVDVISLINLVKIRKIRKQQGLKEPPMSLHLVFSGNPGTGKTTVARLLSKIYHKIGLLSKGHLVETDRSGLVAAYVGQTALKTQKVIDEARGGILFIDEAYTLSSKDNPDDYGHEAIEILLKAMEDNRDDLIVIVAGYPNLMEEFIKSNPGLESRFNKFINFEDYDPDELYRIFLSLCEENDFILDNNCEIFLKNYFVELYKNRGDNFANGRVIRNIFEKTYANQANRLVEEPYLSSNDLKTFILDDFKDIIYYSDNENDKLNFIYIF